MYTDLDGMGIVFVVAKDPSASGFLSSRLASKANDAQRQRWA